MMRLPIPYLTMVAAAAMTVGVYDGFAASTGLGIDTHTGLDTGTSVDFNTNNGVLLSAANVGVGANVGTNVGVGVNGNKAGTGVNSNNKFGVGVNASSSSSGSSASGHVDTGINGSVDTSSESYQNENDRHDYKVRSQQRIVDDNDARAGIRVNNDAHIRQEGGVTGNITGSGVSGTSVNGAGLPSPLR